MDPSCNVAVARREWMRGPVQQAGCRGRLGGRGAAGASLATRLITSRSEFKLLFSLFWIRTCAALVHCMVSVVAGLARFSNHLQCQFVIPPLSVLNTSTFTSFTLVYTVLATCVTTKEYSCRRKNGEPTDHFKVKYTFGFRNL